MRILSWEWPPIRYTISSIRSISWSFNHRWQLQLCIIRIKTFIPKISHSFYFSIINDFLIKINRCIYLIILFLGLLLHHGISDGSSWRSLWIINLCQIILYFIAWRLSIVKIIRIEVIQLTGTMNYRMSYIISDLIILIYIIRNRVKIMVCHLICICVF